MASELKTKYIFRPGYINPGEINPIKMWSVMIFKPIYKLFPFSGIDAPDLAKVMIHVALNGNETTMLKNGHMRTIAKL